MLGAVGQEIHLWSPLQAKEELLEGAGHLDAVVLEGFVQLLDYILKTIILRSGRVDHVFDLAPGRTAEAGQKVDGGLLLFVVDAHLQVVQHDALAVLLVGGRLAIEEGDEVVPGDIAGPLVCELLLASSGMVMADRGCGALCWACEGEGDVGQAQLKMPKTRFRRGCRTARAREGAVEQVQANLP